MNDVEDVENNSDFLNDISGYPNEGRQWRTEPDSPAIQAYIFRGSHGLARSRGMLLIEGCHPKAPIWRLWLCQPPSVCCRPKSAKRPFASFDTVAQWFPLIARLGLPILLSLWHAATRRLWSDCLCLPRLNSNVPIQRACRSSHHHPTLSPTPPHQASAFPPPDSEDDEVC